MPWTVAVSLHEAVATVEARMGVPELEGRVEQAYYAQREDVARELSDEGWSYIVGAGFWSIYRTDPSEGLDGSSALLEPGIVAIVETTQRVVEHGCSESDVSPTEPCTTILGDERVRSATFFDAHAEGAFLHRVHGPESFGRWPEAVGQRLRSRPPAVRVDASLPRVARTATPARSPDPTLVARVAALPTLGPGRVPAALLDTARDWPFVEGAWWTFRVLHSHGNTPTASRIETIEVANSWMDGPESMLFQLTQSPHYSFESFPRLSPLGVDRCLHESIEEGMRLAAMPLFAGGREDTCFRGPRGIPAALFEKLWDPDATVCEEFGGFGRVCGNVAVETALGSHTGCYFVQDELSSVWSAWWHCPGIGLVRYQFIGRESGTLTWDLVDYAIPPLVPVP